MTEISQFRGRVFQALDALFFGDAVSNQVRAIDRMLRDLSIPTGIFTKWHDDVCAGSRADLEALHTTEDDVVLVHYSAWSEFTVPYVQKMRCTKVCVYHNITPHSFFRPGSDLHEFCLKGRKQLPDIVSEFHFFWGDSRFNLQELIDLGADPARCFVVPICIDAAATKGRAADLPPREPGAWLFVGRIAANKGQINLVRLFAAMRELDPSRARRLYLVGGFEEREHYYQSLLKEIDRLELSPYVVVTGKVADAAMPEYFRRCQVFVSMSEHEGFGVPLIEAALQGLPVAALRNTAVPETLGAGAHLADDSQLLLATVRRLLEDEQFRGQILAAQRENARRFSADSVRKSLVDALSDILPRPAQFSSVSIVICTFNRADLLERALDYLQYQTSQAFEVVLIDGPSTDHTAEVIDRFRDRVTVGKNSTRNLSVSRNLGIELSSGDVIAFIDDDAIPFDDWVETILREFNQRPLTVAAIGGPVYFAGQLRFQAEDIGINRFAEARVNIDSTEIGRNGWRRSLLGTNACFRADVIRAVGGFDEQFDYFLDESELSYRLQELNYLVGYAPQLYLRHEFARSANREGSYRFNWYSICKNTAYFIAAYSGLKGRELERCVDRRIENERIAELQYPRRDGRLTEEQYLDAVHSIRQSIAAGLADAELFPQTRPLRPSPQTFMAFTGSVQAYPVAGVGIRPLHICLLTREFPPFVPGGGIGTLYYHLASELLLMGHRVTVVTASTKRSTYRCGRFAIHYEQTSAVCSDAIGAAAFTRNANWAFAALHAVANLHAADPIDVIDSALWDTEALMISLIPIAQRPPLVVRLVTPFPVAARINGWSTSSAEADLLKEAELTLVNHADAVIAISESIATTMEAEYGMTRDARWQTSHCGIAYWPSFDWTREYAELTGIKGLSGVLPKDAKLVLFVGRLEPRKGVDLVLDAAPEFLGADPRAHLALVGSDPRDMAAMAQKRFPAALLERIHFLGPLDDGARDKVMHAAWCLVFPSRYESFGLVPLEAFVHGVPVIGARSGAVPEVVIDEDCGLLFETGNSVSLGQSVVRMLREAGLRQRLSAGALRRAKHFSSRKSAIASIRVYWRLINSRAPIALPNRDGFAEDASFAGDTLDPAAA
jgi:glycosyltransferase involved in cell wall biosynthesis